MQHITFAALLCAPLALAIPAPAPTAAPIFVPREPETGLMALYAFTCCKATSTWSDPNPQPTRGPVTAPVCGQPLPSLVPGSIDPNDLQAQFQHVCETFAPQVDPAGPAVVDNDEIPYYTAKTYQSTKFQYTLTPSANNGAGGGLDVRICYSGVSQLVQGCIGAASGGTINVPYAAGTVEIKLDLSFPPPPPNPSSTTTSTTTTTSKKTRPTKHSRKKQRPTKPKKKQDPPEKKDGEAVKGIKGLVPVEHGRAEKREVVGSTLMKIASATAGRVTP